MTSIPNAPTMVGHRRRLSIAPHLPILRQRQAASLWIGAGMLAVIVIGAVFAPWIAGTSPNAIDLEASLAGPSVHHLLGTDQYGRDILARTLSPPGSTSSSPWPSWPRDSSSGRRSGS